MSARNLPIIAVTGATGVQGGAVVCTLSASSLFTIRAITRNASSAAALALSKLPNVALVTADLSDKSTLVPAFRDSCAIYGVTNFYDPANQIDTLAEACQGCNIADVAKECSVSLVIWSTVPSALIRTAARFDSPRLVENKFTVSQYLKRQGVPHCDLYLGFYIENWTNFGQIATAEDGALEISQPIMRPDVELGMVWVGKDLAPVVLGILNRFGEKQEDVLGKEFYASRGKYSTQDFATSMQNHTGREARVLTPEGSGFKDLDVMLEYYNGWGVYTENVLPDAGTVALGVGFSSLKDFTREVMEPYVENISNI